MIKLKDPQDLEAMRNVVSPSFYENLAARLRELYAEGETVFIYFSNDEIDDCTVLAEDQKKALKEVLSRPTEVGAVIHWRPKPTPRFTGGGSDSRCRH